MATNAAVSADDPQDNTTLTHMALRAGGPVLSYQSVVGMLMWAMLGTRPDLAYVTGVVGRYSANPKRSHWELLKRGSWTLIWPREVALMDIGVCRNQGRTSQLSRISE
jgi:hypothetical protein